MVEQVKDEVCKLLENDDSGHGMDHINRVLELSLKFAEREGANLEIVSFIALLHDVDDYKLFGYESADNLFHAKEIMNKAHISQDMQNEVCSAVRSIGYSKRLNGCSPKTIEGMVVSDADMCDALGAIGILREYSYCIKHGRPFFDKDIFPIEGIAEKHSLKCSDSCVCHMFEKILRLKNLMLTESGYEEALKRHNITVEFLYHLFDEENAFKWIEYLDEYLNVQKAQECKKKQLSNTKS